MADGVVFAQAAQLCATFGLRLANLSQSDVPGIEVLATQCLGSSAIAFFGVLESLPPLPN